MTFHVASEVGQLRQAIIHRPGLELSRLTPSNVESLLFDDVLWAKKAKEEHDAFAQSLRDRGVKVHYFGELLGNVLAEDEGRAFVLDRLCTDDQIGPSLVAPVRELLEDSTERSSPTISSGYLEVRPSSPQREEFVVEQLRGDDFVLPPLPNHLFQRDNSCWIYGGVTVNPMAMAARQRESLHNQGHLQVPSALS